MENTPEHLEHIEHNQHAAHAGGFDRKVAMTMAIIAALLAAVTMLGHRAHNETLSLQTKADILHTQANDEWSHYQARNIRRHAYQANLDMLDMMARAPGTDERYQKAKANWQKQIDDYDAKLPEQEKKAKELVHDAQSRLEESTHAHHRGNWLDVSELAVEVGLVLCSLAVLTKRAPFWLIGIGSAVLGVAIAASAWFVH